MLMMMGSAGEIPTAPKEKVVFMEDMSDSQLAATVMIKHYFKHKIFFTKLFHRILYNFLDFNSFHCS